MFAIAETTTPSVIAPVEIRVAKNQGGRYEFLDALRGIAALGVALQHGAELLWPRYFRWSIEVWRPGEFGVVLFFLCSGYIIPASLEKYASLTRFWAGRFFRLYPLYWFTLGAIALLHYGAGLYPFDDQHPVTAWVSNLTMLQLFLNQPLFIGASWTLAYEMVFYLSVSLLFLTSAHKQSLFFAFALLCVALGSGFYLPEAVFSSWRPDPKALALALSATAFLTGLGWWRAPPNWRARVAVLALAAAIVCLVLNRPHPGYLTFSFFSTMFVGTVMYRSARGQIPARQAWSLFAFAAAALLITMRIETGQNYEPAAQNAFHTWKPEAATFLSAYLLFGLGLLNAKRRYPRVLTFLGTISYSLYLVHAVVIHVVPHVGGEVSTYLVWNAAIIVTSVLTYYAIEKPFQTLGQRVARNMG